MFAFFVPLKLWIGGTLQILPQHVPALAALAMLVYHANALKDKRVSCWSTGGLRI